ncbi:DUF1254 domain-containing protein [Nocardia sp. IFM 10818]
MREPQVTRRAMLGMSAAVVTGLALAACGSDDEPSSSGGTSDDPKAIAADAYTFGYPLVLMDATHAALGTTNQFVNSTTLPTPADRLLVRMNLDTLYSQAWLDLRDGPLVLQVPDMADRYWLLQILDAWSNTRQNPSSLHPRTASGVQAPPYTYLVAGPGWSGPVPDGMTRLDVPTNSAWAIGRIQVNGREDVPRVQELQDRLKLVPLSAWLRGETDSPGRPLVPDPGQTPPPAQVAAMDGPTFFDRMCALMAANPAAPADAPALERFATIGIKPGATTAGLAAEVLNDGAAHAKSEIPKYDDPRTKKENGWTFSADLGAYGTNYALRARTAMQGLGANLAQDAVYPSIFGKADDNGQEVRYRLHFPAGQLPPVDAFWSLTAYDANSYLVPNAAGIYAIGHEVPIVVNSDGTVDIAVQNDDPGIAVPQGNWLPIPESGNFSLTMRLYGPKQEVLDGGWKPPALTPAR